MKTSVIIYNCILLLSHISAQWQAYCKSFCSPSWDINCSFSAGLPASERQGTQVQLSAGPRFERLLGCSSDWLCLHLHKRHRQSILRRYSWHLPSEVALGLLSLFMDLLHALWVLLSNVCPADVRKDRICVHDGLVRPPQRQPVEWLDHAIRSGSRPITFRCRCLPWSWNELHLDPHWRPYRVSKFMLSTPLWIFNSCSWRNATRIICAISWAISIPMFFVPEPIRNETNRLAQEELQAQAE